MQGFCLHERVSTVHLRLTFALQNSFVRVFWGESPGCLTCLGSRQGGGNIEPVRQK